MVFRKRFLAVAMVGAMVLGSSITAFAEDVNGATGTGTNTGHLNIDVVDAILPTSSVDATFAFTMDPENILASADKFTDGTTAIGEDFANDDLVYFKTDSGYDSTSKAVTIKAKNYVAADVSVTAKVGPVADGKTLIPMAASEAERAAASDATLLLTLKVGGNTGVIVPGETGVTVTDTIAAQNDKFDTKWDADSNGYKVVAQAVDTWLGQDVQLIGKMKGGTIGTDVVAPSVVLTWTVGAHSSVPTISNATAVSGQAWDYTATFSKGTALSMAATGLTACKWSATIDGTYNTSANITVVDGTLTIAAGMWGSGAAGDVKYLKVTIGENDYIIKVTIA